MILDYDTVKPENDITGLYGLNPNVDLGVLDSIVPFYETPWHIQGFDGYGLAQKTMMVLLGADQASPSQGFYFIALLAEKGKQISPDIKDGLYGTALEEQTQAALDATAKIEGDTTLIRATPTEQMFHELDAILNMDLSTPLVGNYAIDSPVVRRGYVVLSEAGDTYVPMERIYCFRTL